MKQIRWYVQVYKYIYIYNKVIIPKDCKINTNQSVCVFRTISTNYKPCGIVVSSSWLTVSAYIYIYVHLLVGESFELISQCLYIYIYIYIYTCWFLFCVDLKIFIHLNMILCFLYLYTYIHTSSYHEKYSFTHTKLT